MAEEEARCGCCGVCVRSAPVVVVDRASGEQVRVLLCDRCLGSRDRSGRRWWTPTDAHLEESYDGGV
jgi:hypothetical protein